jgi:2,4-dienoyl-CoA reductase-like NADH-dependent reductase (Old Yellow Enzyme family)
MILDPFKINKITLPNRIVVAPMCQYSAINGCPSQWHYGHFHQLANSGAGSLIFESTSVNMSGRITLKDLVLSNQKQEIEFTKIAEAREFRETVSILQTSSHVIVEKQSIFPTSLI